MLTGQAKKDYQRKYMANRRAMVTVRPKPKELDPEPVRPKLDPANVRPIVLDPVRPKVKTQTTRMPHRPEGMSDNQYNYVCFRAGVLLPN